MTWFRWLPCLFCFRYIFEPEVRMDIISLLPTAVQTHFQQRIRERRWDVSGCVRMCGHGRKGRRKAGEGPTICRLSFLPLFSCSSSGWEGGKCWGVQHSQWVRCPGGSPRAKPSHRGCTWHWPPHQRWYMEKYLERKHSTKLMTGQKS